MADGVAEWDVDVGEDVGEGEAELDAWMSQPTIAIAPTDDACANVVVTIFHDVDSVAGVEA